jgi:hypothetical protein
VYPGGSSSVLLNSIASTLVSSYDLLYPPVSGILGPGCDPAPADSLVRASELLPAEIANRYESEDDRVDGHSQQRCV